MNQKDNRTNAITEHLFREFYQEVFSALVLKFGSTHIDMIEDALQEAFYTALKSWKHNKYPENTKGWLFIVAKNYIINRLKRDQKKASVQHHYNDIETISVTEKEDAQLQLLLACARLRIKDQAKLIFTLKSICGFGVTEISNNLLISKENIYKQLQRAKKKLQLVPKAYFDRLDTLAFKPKDVSYIESIIYFMFNEGYDSFNSTSDRAINKLICFDAVRLAHLLVKRCKNNSSKHLLALCYFHMARFDSRISEESRFVSLRKQDRSKWDDDLIQIGFKYLVQPKKLNRYYLEALIATCHLGAKTFSATNWSEILNLYNALLVTIDTPVIRLNRAICLFELGKNKEAAEELQKIMPKLESDYLYFSMSMAEYLEDKDIELSKFWYQKSLKNTNQIFRKELIENRLSKLDT